MMSYSENRPLPDAKGSCLAKTRREKFVVATPVAWQEVRPGFTSPHQAPPECSVTVALKTDSSRETLLGCGGQHGVDLTYQLHVGDGYVLQYQKSRSRH